MLHKFPRPYSPALFALTTARRVRKRVSTHPFRLRCECLEPRLLLAANAIYPSVTLDPADRLATSRVLGAWDGASSDGWQLNNVANWTVSGGVLTVTSQNGTGTPAQVDLRAIASGPTLDYGYFDYLQFRLQLPANYSKDLSFSFGTTTRTGFAADRVFTIPASSLAQDGAFHTYRLDLGLVIWWRDTLYDLRIMPLGQTGANETASLDYVEVGDVPGDTLGLNTDLNLRADSGGTVTLASAQHIESKHFAVWWDPAVNPDGIAFNTATHGRNALRMLEESYQVYTKVLNYKEPFLTTSGTGSRLKLNLITWYSGYWEGVWNGRAHMNITTGGLQDENWGSPVPHEFGHAVDSHQGAALAGGHWESHANYLREARTTWFAPLFAAGSQSTVSLNPLVWSNFRQDANRIIYEDYRIHTALESYAEAMGLPYDTAARLWKLGSTNQTAWAKLASLLPVGTSIKDVAANLLKYWPMLDMAQKEYIRGLLWTTATEKAEFEYKTGSPLIPAPDIGSSWYRVPFERAPEKYAYMFHELVPTSSGATITAVVQGVDLVTTDEDWRWGFIAIDGSGNARYSTMWAPGAQSFTLNPGENRVLLFVVATPTSTALDLDSFYNTKPNDKNADRLRYPYEVSLINATPVTKQLDWNTASGHTHPNGGGWVANTATVASTAYVGPNARVLGTAQVLGNARIEDYAVIAGNARVRDSAVVSGYAVVYDNGVVQNNGRVRDHAMVTQNSQVQGNALLEDYARIGDSVVARDWAIARGDSYVWGSAVLSGYAIADYDYSMNYNLSDGVHMNHIPFDSYFNVYYAQTQTKPRGLIASYRVEETAGAVLWDEFGTEHAWLRGAPGRAKDSTSNSYLTLNGSSQYAVLDRSLGDLTDGSFALWAFPQSTDADETLLYFGSSATTYLKLVSRDANGLTHLTISVNGVVKELAATLPTAYGAWTHIALTFGGGLAKLYINGQTAGTLVTTFRPVDVLGADDYKSANTAYYLGQDAAGNYFTGNVDDIRFYNATLTQAEVKNEMARGGVRTGQFFATAPMNFNGTSTTVESGVHSGPIRTISLWVYPRSNAATYTALFDSYNENGSGTTRGNGVGLNGGNIYLRLDGVGLFNTGVAVALNTWQQIGVVFNNGIATVYLNGVQRATRSYTVATQAKNYHIGFYQSDTAATPTRTGYFDGMMYDARISEVAVTPSGKLDAPPVASNDSATVAPNAGTTLLPLANDSDPYPIATLKISGTSTPAHGSVTILPNATAVTYTPVSGYTGSDSFQYTLTDSLGSTALATVTLNVAHVFTSIVISPSGANLRPGETVALQAQAYNQVGAPFVPGTPFTWTIDSGGGSLVPSGGNNLSAQYAAGNDTETVTVRATNGAVSATASVNVVSELTPGVAWGPSYLIGPTGTSALLQVMGADLGGEAGLTYTWSVTGNPPAGVTFSGDYANGTNGAKQMNAQFTKAGTYSLQVRLENGLGYGANVPLTVVVPARLTSITVTPPSAQVAANRTVAFAAQAFDQFGALMNPVPALQWSVVNGGGSIDASGVYTASRTAGAVTIKAALGGVQATASVTVSYEELAWYKADTSATTLTDSSGNNKTATLTGGLNTSYSFGTGVAGSALHFVSGTPYASLPAGIVSGLTDFTISTWIKVDTLATWSRVFDFGTGTTSNMFLSPRANGVGGPLRFAITTTGGGGEQQINGPVLATGSWYHVAITLAGSTGTMYVNGVAVATNTGMTIRPTDLGNTTLNYLGKSQYPDPAFLGWIDDIRLFGRALSATEIANLTRPTIVKAPAPSAAQVSTTAGLSVLAEDVTAGEGALTYTWALMGNPPAAATFSQNGTNAAKNTIVTFTKPGTYNFQVTVVNPRTGLTAVANTSVVVKNAVTGRYLFYNNSSFDSYTPGTGVGDDAALATDKAALLPGQTAAFANYSSYDKGINGIMIDVANLSNPGAVTAADFVFSIGTVSDLSTWTLAPAPVSVTVRPGGGANGADRVVIIWGDGVIVNTWLRVMMKAAAATGLALPEAFYFGNQIGETGNVVGDTAVDGQDVTLITNNAGGPVGVTSVYDINRDGMVDGTDAGLASGHPVPTGVLGLIATPGSGQVGMVTVANVKGTVEEPVVTPVEDGHGVGRPELPPVAMPPVIVPPVVPVSGHGAVGQGEQHRTDRATEVLTPAATKPGRKWALWELSSMVLGKVFGGGEEEPSVAKKKAVTVVLPTVPKPLPGSSATKRPVGR